MSNTEQQPPRRSGQNFPDLFAVRISPEAQLAMEVAFGHARPGASVAALRRELLDLALDMVTSHPGSWLSRLRHRRLLKHPKGEV